MSKPIFLDAPCVGALEKSYLNQAIDEGFVSTAGPFVPEFEDKFANYLKQPQAISTQSGTAALHMALYELGIGADDEVIVPALSFVATVNPIAYVGATPVFVDVDSKTWTMDTTQVETAITPKTKAIIPVHLYGIPCDMTPLLHLAKRHNLALIEDATESLGATLNGQFTGTLGRFGCFSFNGNKTITTGGGGMIVGSNASELHHIKFLVNQARDDSQGYFHPEIGFNYRMTNLEAAMGLAQLQQLESFLSKKRSFHAQYHEALNKVPGIQFQEVPSGANPSYWLTCIQIRTVSDMGAFQKALHKKGVPTRRIFMPIPHFPPYKTTRAFDVSEQIYTTGLCLPSSTLNTSDQIHTVCKHLVETL